MKIKTTGPQNQQFYLLLAGNVVVLALIGFFVLRPIFGLLVKHTSEIAVTRAETHSLQQKATDLRKLKETYPQYEAVYAPALQNLPKTKDVAGYQTELEELAKLTSNQLITINTSASAAGPPGTTKPGAPATVTAGGFQTFPAKMEIIGTYATLLDFVHRIETMDRFTRVTALDLKSADASGGVRASLEVQALYLGK